MWGLFGGGRAGGSGWRADGLASLAGWGWLAVRLLAGGCVAGQPCVYASLALLS